MESIRIFKSRRRASTWGDYKGAL